MTGEERERAKGLAVDYVERNAGAVADLNDSLFYFGELGMQEHESTALMAELLGDAGFAVEVGIAGMPPAFQATYGSGKPLIAVHTEYDANPENSQASGVPRHLEITPGAPGHCEGHNANGAVMAAGALAAKHAMERAGIEGTLKVIGAPAEEQLLSRPYLVRDGYFDDVDVALHDHVSEFSGSSHGLLLSALVSAHFTYTGETAHAAMRPWDARDALDAVVLLDAGMAQFREHFEPDMTAHRAIIDGGTQPNVIPAKATVWWYFRHPTADGAGRLFEQAKRIAEGAALMTNTELAVDVLSAVWPVRGNRTVAEVLQANAEMVGMPDWTEDERALARKTQEAAGVEAVGLMDEVTPLKAATRQIAASNDAGDVSWVVPMGRLWFPANIPNVGFHHWAGGVVLATSIAHKGAVTGAKVLAASMLDFLMDPDLVTQAKATFAEEIDGVEYSSLLPKDQAPPVDLNWALMEKHRPAMRSHYPKKRPRFAD